MKRLALATAFLCVAPFAAEVAHAAETSAPSAAPTDAKTLLQAMATVEGLEAKFTEEKHLALLKAPLVSTGVIYYTRPGHLMRMVEAPGASTVRIGPTSLEVTDASGKQAFDLRSRPDIKMFVESFVHIVAGNYDALATTYDLGFVAPPASVGQWTLTLTPLRAPLSDLVKRLEVRGTGYAVTSIVVLETRGDSTEIKMSSVDAKRVFTSDERKRFFGLSPATAG